MRDIMMNLNYMFNLDILLILVCLAPLLRLSLFYLISFKI